MIDLGKCQNCNNYIYGMCVRKDGCKFEKAVVNIPDLEKEPEEDYDNEGGDCE